LKIATRNSGLTISFETVQTGAIDPAKVLTQREPLSAVIDAYKAFDTRQPGWVKIELMPALKSH
jgi:threonine dehydrogenase-like Zn-dependent dehydrogenase